MYGLILENLSQYICNNYGTEKWEEIRKLANIGEPTFSVHKIYPDNYVPRITSKACEILSLEERAFLYDVGTSFVSFVGVYGYDRVLSVLGRQFRDFMNGLDNLHEYLKFSYPKLKPPSFFCNDETESGMILHYRSKRKYFLWYAIGQIKEVGRYYYQTDVSIKVIAEKYEDDDYSCVLQLIFDNRAYMAALQNEQNTKQLFELTDNKVANTDQISMMPLKANAFFQIFPFCLVFDSKLIIRAVGSCLQVVLPNIAGSAMPKFFDLTKPKVGYNYASISSHTNNTFELVSVQPLKRDIYKRDFNFKLQEAMHNKENLNNFNSDLYGHTLLKMKGQMLYMEEWQCMVFLGAPNIADVETMTRTGLYLNDLSLHDFSRDMVLAGQQQSAELKLALDQELHKSKQLEESMLKLDVEMKRTDELLYQMIADLLRSGETALDKTCEYFASVTILFSDIVNFTVICSRITPMQVVNMLNSMYSLFDELTERHRVYKVETIGDAYMICSGGGIIEGQDGINHAQKVCETALDMIKVVYHVKDPSSGNNLNIRIGPVVGGIVGLKMPRYCLFGDAVNTASRIESSSEAQMIHISEMTKAMLDTNEWNVLERGTVELKGKGLMKTYYLLSRRMNGVEEDNVTASIAPLKLIRKIHSPKAVLRHELKRALKLANRDDKPVTNYTLPTVSVDESYESKLNQMMQIQLSKEISLNDVYNTKNTNISDQSYKNSKNSLNDIEAQQRQQLHQLQQLQNQTGIDKSGTNKIIINNSFLGNDKIPDTVTNAFENVLENNEGDNGCFSCNKKLKRSNGCSIL